MKIKRKEAFYFSLVMLIVLFYYQIGYMGPFEFKMKTDGRVKTSIPFAATSFKTYPRGDMHISLFDEGDLYREKKLSDNAVFYFPRGELGAGSKGLPLVISHPFYELKREPYNLGKNWSGLITCCWTVRLPDYEVRSYEAIAEEDYLPRIIAAYEAGDEEEAVRIQYKLRSRMISGFQHWARVFIDKDINRKQYYEEIISYYQKFAEKYIPDENAKKDFLSWLSI